MCGVLDDCGWIRLVLVIVQRNLVLCVDEGFLSVRVYNGRSSCYSPPSVIDCCGVFVGDRSFIFILSLGV